MELEADIDALEGDIHQAAGEEFKIGSPQQLGVVLFETLGYPVIKRTRKTKSYSTDAETLETLASRGEVLGEIVIVIAGAEETSGAKGDDGALLDQFREALGHEEGDLKRAVKRVARAHGWSRAEAKRRLTRVF